MARRKYSDREKAEAPCVYGLRARGEAQYFYVGSTQFQPAKRLSDHLRLARLGYAKNLHLVRKFQQVGPANVQIDVLEIAQDSNRLGREYFWIHKLRSEGHHLTNILVDGSRYLPVAVDEPNFWQLLASLTALPISISGSNAKAYALFRSTAALLANHLLTKRMSEVRALYGQA